MNIRDKDLIVFDLDGTLAPSKQPMEPDMAELLDRFIKMKKVAVISGGGYPQFENQFLRSLPRGVEGFANMVLLPTSGTRMLLWRGGWVEKYSENLTKAEKEQIMAAFDYSLHKSGFQQPARVYGELLEDRGSQITFSANGQQAPFEEKSKWDPDHKKRQRIAGFLKEKLPGFDVRIGGTNSIDITRKGVNKAYGIHKLEEHLKVPIERMVFVGDSLFYGGNDYPARSTGVDCIQVSGPEETKKLIQGWIG